MPFWSSANPEGLTPVGDHLKNINVKTNLIGDAVDEFDGTQPADGPVQQASDNTAAAIQAAIDDVEKMNSISYATATGLLSIFKKLIPDTKDMLQKFTDKKDLFLKAGFAQLIIDNLKKQAVLGQTLDDKIYAKLPLLAQPLSRGQYSQIDEFLTKAIAEWEGYKAEGAAAPGAVHA